jgi:hypothetical protein
MNRKIVKDTKNTAVPSTENTSYSNSIFYKNNTEIIFHPTTQEDGIKDLTPQYGKRMKQDLTNLRCSVVHER